MRPILPLALLLLSGCISTTTPEAFCREQIEAECRKEAACQNQTDWQACVVAREPSCRSMTEATLCGAGKKFDAGRAQECVDGYAGSECLGLSRGDRPASCYEICTAL